MPMRRTPTGRQRFTSTFLRDYGEFFLHAFSEKEFRNNGYGAADVAAQKRTATIEDFASPTFNATPMGRHARAWGSINRPNFYVRHLVGVDDGDVVMTMRDLKAALATLAYFTHVFLLDGDIQRGVQHNLTGRDDVHIRKPQSNNPYSGANKRDKRLPAPPERRERRSRRQAWPWRARWAGGRPRRPRGERGRGASFY